ncbi:DUF4917 family protein [Vibrio parahaemolyticus]|nr:DUF4917 family protein [Vibrio parahaemolyticus]
MIENWNDIEGEGWDNLLLGNGFSIGISPNFRYDSLLDVVDDYKIKMYPHARDLFERKRVGTVNFEEVLKVIYHAYLVNFWNTEAIETLYYNVRKSLIEAVNIAHVDYDNVPVKAVEAALSDYSAIYTTNYDLIPYWSIMSNDFDGYCDYFWNGGVSFNANDTDIFGKKTPIYYLHGALHLRTNVMGTTQKVRATGETSIKQIIGENNLNNIPLFISEGKSDIKLQRIRENDYLSFCYNSLMNLEGSLLVFGHGLDKDYDEHILAAIKSSSIERLAVSVFSGMRPADKKAFASSLNAYFADSKIDVVFFESGSHPLSLPKE